MTEQVCVARERELSQLLSFLDRALTGQDSVCVGMGAELLDCVRYLNILCIGEFFRFFRIIRFFQLKMTDLLE